MTLPVFDLQTAVRMSLFTDRRVELNELPPGETYRRGWWGDALNSKKVILGSKLWLLHRRKLDFDTGEDAKRYALEALDWLITGGFADSIEVLTEPAGRRRLKIQVTIHFLSGRTPETFNLSWPKVGDSNAI